MHVKLDPADVLFLLSFCPDNLPNEVPEGLDPTFYHTLTYEGDVKIAERLQKIWLLTTSG